MDKKTLEATVVRLRDEGFKFREIAEAIKRDYGVTVTRSYVYKIYSRTTEGYLNIKEKQNQLVVTDVVNLYAIGYKASEIHRILHSDRRLSYNKVRIMISNEAERIEQIIENYVSVVVKMITESEVENSIEDIIKALTYRNVKPSEKGLNKIMGRVIEEIVKVQICKGIASCFKYCDNDKVIKEVLEGLGNIVEFGEVKSVYLELQNN